MNSLVEAYRSRVPNDPRSDDDITLLLGKQNSVDGSFNHFTDFVQDYNKLIAPPPPEEKSWDQNVDEGVRQAAGSFMRAVSDVPAGLLESIGIAATKLNQKIPLGGPDKPEDTATYQAGQAIRNVAGEIAPEPVPELQKSFLATKLPETFGSIAGFVAGAGLEKAFIKGSLDAVLNAAAKDAFTEAITAGATKQEASLAAQIAVSEMKKHAAVKAAEMIPTGLLGAGTQAAGAYKDAIDSGATPDQAFDAYLLNLPVGASMALPAHAILGEGETLVGKLARDTATGTGVMAGQSVAGNLIARQTYDPNRSVLAGVGETAGAGGIVTAALSALSHKLLGGRESRKFDPAVERHFADVTSERRQQLDELKGRLEANEATQEDISALRTLNPQEQAYMAVAEPSSGEVTVTESQQTQSETDQVQAGAKPTAPASPAEPEVPQVDPKEIQKQAGRAAAAAALASGNDPLAEAAKARVEAAAAQTDPNPTAAQKIAGNYSKGKVTLDGLNISIENPKGSERTGVGPDGKPWSVTMPSAYGYFLGTEGADGDHVDTYIGPNPAADPVYVVDQINPATGKFDESKVMLGFDSEDQAKATYDAAFSDGKGPERRGAVSLLTKDELKAWLNGGKTDKPLAYKEPVESKFMPGPKATTLPATMDTARMVDQMAPEEFLKQFGKFNDINLEIGRKATPEDYAELKKMRDVAQLRHELALQRYEKARTPANEKMLSATMTMPQFFNEAIAEYDKTHNEKGAPAPTAPKTLPGYVQDQINQDADLARKIGVEDDIVRLAKSGKVAKEIVYELGDRMPVPEIDKTRIVRSVRVVHGIKNAEEIAAESKAESNAEGIRSDKEQSGEAGKKPEGGKADSGSHVQQTPPGKPEPVGSRTESTAKEDARPVNKPKLSKALRAKSDAIKGEMGDLLKEWDTLKDKLPPLDILRSNKESGFVINPIDGVDQKHLEIIAKLAVKAVEHGVYKFGEWAALMVETLGDRVVPFLAQTYESMRDHYLKAEKPVSDRMTPRSDMAEALDKLASDLTQEQARAYPPEHRIGAADVDVEARGTTEQSGRGTGEAHTVEPAWFVPREKSAEKLGPRLLSDSSPPTLVDGKSPNNSMTYRLAAVYDRQTGQVHLVSTFENNRETRLTKFAPDIGQPGSRVKSVSLKEVLDAKTGDGDKRFQVIGSARTKNLHEYYHQIYGTRAEFRDQFAKPLMEAQDAVQSGARQEQLKMDAFGTDAGASYRARLDDQVAAAQQEGWDVVAEAPTQAHEEQVLKTPDIEEPQGQPAEAQNVDLPKQRRINLVDNEVRVLRDQLPGFDNVDDFVDMLADPKAISDDLYQVIEKIAGQDVYFFRQVAQHGLEDALKDYGYDVNKRPTEAVEQRPAEPAKADIQAAAGQLGPGPVRSEADLRGGEDRAGQPGQEGAGGNQEPDTAGTAIKLTTPEPPARTEPVNSEHAQLLKSIHESAAAAGIDVQAVRGALGAGAYDPKSRTLLQVVGNTVGRQDVKTAFHEVAHDVFAHEPREVRDRLLRAVDGLSDEALGVDLSADSRIRAADPAGLGKAAVNEERLVDATAERLVNGGFDPARSKGLARKFVRHLRDYYLRAAMAVQRMLGFKENPELARRYFENRIKQLLSGDNTPLSYFDFIGAHKLTSEEAYHQMFKTANNYLGERVNDAGQIEYNHQPDITSEAARFNRDNALRYTLPSSTDSKRDPVFALEMLVAGYNHQIEVLRKAGEELSADPDLAKHIAGVKSNKLHITPEKYIRRLLRITADPERLKWDLESKPAPGGNEPVSFDQAKTIDDFKGEAAKGHANIIAQKNADSLVSRTGNMISHKQVEVSEYEKSLKSREKALEKAKSDYWDAVEAKSEVADNPKLDALIAVKKDRMDMATRRLARGKQSIARLNTELQALRTVLPGFQAEQSRLNARLGIGVEFTFRNGAPYVVVHDPDASSASIISRLKDKASVQTLTLDSQDRLTTDPKTLENHLRQNLEFLRKREVKAKAGDENALDSVYQGVKNATNVLSAHNNFTVDVGAAERSMFGLSVSPEGVKLADGIGTPLARMFKEMLILHNNIMEAFHRHIKVDGRKTFNGEDAMLNLAPGFSRDSLRRDVLFPAMHTMQHARDIGETLAFDPVERDRSIFQRVKDEFEDNPALMSRIGNNKSAFFSALWKHLNHTADLSAYQESKARTGGGLKQKLGIGVLDPKIKSINPATGQMETAARSALPIGPGKWTWRQRFSDTARQALDALGGSNWADLDTFFKRPDSPEGFKSIAERFAEDPEALTRDLLPFANHEIHGESVKANFFDPLSRMRDDTPFITPERGELARTEADPELVKQAFDESGFMDNGNMVGFAEKLYKLHDGESDLGAYIQEIVDSFNKIYQELGGKVKEHGGSAAKQDVGIRGMINNAFIDARTIDHMPGEWFDYHTYDEKDLFNTAQSIAGQTSMGRGGEKAAQAIEGMMREVVAAKKKIERVVNDVLRVNPNAGQKEINSALTKAYGKELPTLKRQAKGDKLIGSAVRGLSDYFRKDNSPDGSVKVAVRMLGTLGNLMVQQGTSAIRQLEQLDGVFLKYGVSKETAMAFSHMVRTVSNESLHSLVQAVGVIMRDNSETHRMYVENNLHDPDLMVRWKGLMDPLEGEGRASRAFRVLNSALGMTANLRGDKDTHTGLRIMQPFTTFSMMVDKGLTGGVWNMATRLAGYGRKYYQEHPEHFGASDFKLDADKLGLKGMSRNTFNRFVNDMREYGVSYDDIVRDSLRRNDGTVLTNEQVKALYGLSVSVLSSKSNIATMPTEAYNNTMWRAVSPLLGWPFRRMMDVLSVGRTPEGKHSLAQFGHGLAGLGVMALGGLSVSALANQYQEDLLGKKSNLRPVVSAGDPKEQMMSVFENLNRAGTFGLLGELANGAVNVGIGGDNRNILDANSRVLALSSISGIQQAISSFINQDRTVDYTHVVRPLISSLGGGGVLQYIQLANNILGLDNVESRTTARINAKNYLQVVGRQLGMSVRSHGGSYSPTPLSPYLTDMELAAYANNPADFNEAYQAAIAQAKEDGEPDPVNHVKLAYAARNPLRQVFATPPTKADYDRILAELPDSGREDVSTAINNFNQFADSIGARPFEGKADKKPAFTMGQRMSLPVFSKTEARNRAASALISR